LHCWGYGLRLWLVSLITAENVTVTVYVAVWPLIYHFYILRES